MGGIERQKLEAALTAKQETEAKLHNLDTRNKELQMEITDLKEKVSVSPALSPSRLRCHLSSVTGVMTFPPLFSDQSRNQCRHIELTQQISSRW